MEQAAYSNPSQIQQWIDHNWDVKKIEKELSSLGLDIEAIQTRIQEFKKAKRAKRSTTGFAFLITGAFVGFVSCVLTIANPVPALYDLVLYGLTSVAILVIVIGLYFVME